MNRLIEWFKSIFADPVCTGCGYPIKQLLVLRAGNLYFHNSSCLFKTVSTEIKHE